MKAYQVKIGKRGEQTATMFIVEAQDYRYAILRASEKFAEMNQCKVEDCAVCDLQMIEEIEDEDAYDRKVALELTKLQAGADAEIAKSVGFVRDETLIDTYKSILAKVKAAHSAQQQAQEIAQDLHKEIVEHGAKIAVPAVSEENK